MKKTVFVLLITVLSLHASAQRLGITGGISIASMKAKVSGASGTSEGKVGLTGGIFLEVPVTNDIAFRPGINFTQKGGKNKEGSETDIITLNYVEVPFDLIYYTPAGFFIGGGPAVSIGLSGKQKYSDGVITEEQDMEFGSGDDQVKRLELSGTVMSGWKFRNGITFSAGYNFGLSNLSNVTSDPWLGDGISLKNRYFGLRLGYILPHTRKQ